MKNYLFEQSIPPNLNSGLKGTQPLAGPLIVSPLWLNGACNLDSRSSTGLPETKVAAPDLGLATFPLDLGHRLHTLPLGCNNEYLRTGTFKF